MKGKAKRDDWHLRTEGGKVRVYDKDWKFRCEFPDRQAAQEYIASQKKPGGK